MTEKRNNGASVGVRRIIAYVVLILLSFLCLFWFWILLVNATRSKGELTKGFSLIPSKWLLKNWQGLRAGTLPVWNGLINSLIVSGGSAVLCVYFSTMTAYAIHAYRFKGRNAIYTFILMIMMIPSQVTALGFLQLIRNMNLEDNLIPLIIPAIAAPVTFFYMKQYMDSTLSLSLIEAARIDGAGELRIFNSVVLPLMKPAIAVQAIFTFVSSWNNLFTPLILLTDQKKYTLPIMISLLRGDIYKTEYGAVYLGLSMTALPLIIVYLALSKYIIAGVALGSVKG